MMNNYLKITALLMIGMLVSCNSKTAKQLTVEVESNQDFSRKEVVSIPVEKLSELLKSSSQKNIRVKKQDSQDYLLTQWIDANSDGVTDALLFQAEVGANSKAEYRILIDSLAAVPVTKAVVFSRFVPERIDDYAWENNKVAFRAYGPEAQRLTEAGRSDGTLSSGIDLWLKKVDYSIINSWYAKNVEAPGYYHIDHGEGYDPYHVGVSRGTGGLGIWENDSLQVSKNYIKYKTIATGPLRTVFELTYAPWSSYGVHETKRISLDLDSNFSKFEITLDADKKVPNYTIGITLHEKEGEINMNREKGWFRHWEPINGSFVGEGIVLDPSIVNKAFANNSDVPDHSNLLIVTKPQEKLTFYAGFAWTESGQVSNVKDWEMMLDKQAEILANPLKVMIK